MRTLKTLLFVLALGTLLVCSTGSDCEIDIDGYGRPGYYGYGGGYYYEPAPVVYEAYPVYDYGYYDYGYWW